MYSRFDKTTRLHGCLFPYFILSTEGAAAFSTHEASKASIPRSVDYDDQGVDAGDERGGEGEEGHGEADIEGQMNENDDEVISDDFISSFSSLSSPPPSPPRYPSTASEEDEGELNFMHAPDWVLYHSIRVQTRKT